jgi:DNA primase
VIPSYDKYGELNYFVSRGINDFVWPKYMNPETDKEELIFNERFLNYDSTIYIVEGVFDHLVIPNSVPLLGKFMTEKFKHLLLTKCKANVVILLDDDAYDDAVRLYKDLNVGDLYNKVKLCIPPNGYDPSLMYEKFGYKGILKLLRSAKKMQESEIY